MAEFDLDKDTSSTEDEIVPANPYDLNDEDNQKEVNKRIDKVLATERFSRTLFSRDWFRNILFYTGAQWIIYTQGRWRQRELPEWFPRAQTNKFAEKWNDLVAQLVTGKRIPITYEPSDLDAPGDVAVAESAEKIRDVIYAEAKVDEKEYEIASWLVGTGNCFGIAQYNMDEGAGVSFVQFQNCACGTQLKPEDLAASGGACPECGESDGFTPAQAPDGSKIGDEYPIGCLDLDVASPFEIRLDHRVTEVRNLQRFVRLKRYDVDWARENWPDFKDKIHSDTTGDDPEQFYLDVISHITSGFNVGAGILADGTNSKTPKVTAYMIYEMPSKRFPQGLKAIRIGKNSSTTVELGPLTSEYGAGTKKGKKFLPIIHWGFDYVPGRLYRKTRMDDIIPMQLFRNIVEANMRLSVQRMGNGIWLNPKGSGVDILTGEPGQKIDYNPVSLGGTSFAKPERIPAELNNLGPLITLLAKIDDEIERVAGTFFLTGGTAPPGVTAASALAYLGEKSQQSMSALMASWAKSWRVFEMYMLEIARASWDETRTRVVLGKNKKWHADKFSKADLQGSVNLVIDYNGMFPKSQATTQAQIAQLTQLGIVQPQDPEMQLEVLKKFGATELKGSANLDMIYAAKVQDRFLQDKTGAYIPMVRPAIDNSTVLFHEAVNFSKTDEFDELPPERQQVWLAYCDGLVKDIIMRRAALTQAGLDPDVPATAEVPSQAAQDAAQAAAALQSGGTPSGAEGPDPRMDAHGNPIPAPTPDIAASSNVPGTVSDAVNSPDASAIKLPGQRAIPIPGGGQ